MLTRRSLRLRIAVGGGLALALGAWPAWAYWTAQQSAPAQPVTIGHLDLTLNGQNGTVAATALTANNLTPGSTVAGVVTIANAGSIPVSYYATVTGTNTDGKNLATNLTVVVSRGGTPSGSGGLGSTCTGGTSLPGASMSTGTLAYGSSAANRRPLAVGATETLCVQLALPTTAPSSVQGASTSVTIAANGTQVGAP